MQVSKEECEVLLNTVQLNFPCKNCKRSLCDFTKCLEMTLIEINKPKTEDRLVV